MVLIPESRFFVRIRTAKAAWLAAGLSLAAAAGVLCAVFWREAQGAYDVWTGSTAYNHCFLILPVAAYLAWQRREVIDRLAPQPDFRALALLVPLSLLWLAAARLSVLELQQITALAMLETVALTVLGWAAFRALLMPFLYLFFLVPTGYFLVPSLQDFTAWFAVAAIKLVGIPVYWDGTLIEVPAGSFVVAEACAGLRFLIASVAFGVFFASLVYRSRLRWLLFVGLSVVVPIIANGMRAFGIIALAEVTGNAAAVEADHIIYGWGFFTAVTLLLIVIGLSFSDEREAPGRNRPAARLVDGAATPWGILIAALIAVGIAASGPAYAQLRFRQADDAALAAASVSPPAGPWMPSAQTPIAWKPKILDPDRELSTVYSNGGKDVLLYVALYKDAGLHNNLVRGMDEIADGKHWNVAGRGSAVARIGGKDATVATTEIAGAGRRMLVWDFYVVGGRIAASPLKAKLLQLENMFGGTTGVDAFVAVAADRNSDGAHPDETLRSFLAAMAPPGL